jgi:hypothetical protein
MRRRRAVESKRCLGKIDIDVPAEFDVNLVCDNYGIDNSAHRGILAGLTLPLPHPPHAVYSSWIIQVDRRFAELACQLIERGNHRNVQIVGKRHTHGWITDINNDPKLFVRTIIAEQILPFIQRLERTNQRRRTLAR